jgi:hypothetical protein
MKIKVVTILFLLGFNSLLYGCPACVGVVQQDSPPFFADEFCDINEQPNQCDSITSGSGF